MSVDGMFRMESKRNEAIETTSLILQVPQSDHMINTLFERFDVAVQHRRVRTNTHPMHGPSNVQPSRPGNLMTGNQRTCPFGKDFCAAAGTAPQARVA